MNQRARLHFGFASNMVLLLWCVCGGFLLHMLEANFLTMLLKPNYEKPVDFEQDILDRGLRLITVVGGESKVETWKISPAETTRRLAGVTDVPKVIFL